VKNSAVRRPRDVLGKVRPSPARYGSGRLWSPERNPGKAHPGRNEQRFFDVAERQWRSLGPVLEWAFGHREPQTESPRSSAVQSLEEWVFPDLMQ